MPRYYFEQTIVFAGEIEAEDLDAAYATWEDALDISTPHYDGVLSESVEILDEDEDEDA